MYSKKHALVGICAFAVFLLASNAAYSQTIQPQYVFREIQVPGYGLISPYGVNNQGQVVGTLTDNTGTHGFFLQPQGDWNVGTGPVTGTVTVLDHPNGEATFVGINGAGTIVGSVSNGAGGRKGFLYFGGTYHDIIYPGATITEVAGINDAGLIVGYYVGSNDTNRHGFIYDGTTFTSVDIPGATQTVLQCISNDNRICGGTDTMGSFVIQGKIFTTLKMPGAAGGTGVAAANVNGRVVGSVDFSNPTINTDGYLYDGSTYRVLDGSDGLGGNQYPRSINDRNSVVGWAMPTFNEFAYYAYDQTTVQPQQIATGLQSNGATYEIMVPANWNGDLVLYAHGIVDPGQPLQLPSNDSRFPPLAQGVLDRGYALAFSSYAENGYAVQSGIDSTLDLKRVFTARFGVPQHTLVTGHSEGGLVTLALTEKYPQEFAGALAMCGPIGGSLPELQYLGDVRDLYDAFFASFPFKLPGNAANLVTVDFQPGSTAFDGVASNLLQGLLPLYPTIQLTATARIPANSTEEAVAGGLLSVGYSVRFGQDLVQKAGGQFYGNLTTGYHDPVWPQLDLLLNLAVLRVSPNPAAVAFVQSEYTPTGVLRIPMYTLHTMRDPLVPAFHEDIYAQVVAPSSAGNLYQKRIDRWGHCEFTNLETFDAFDALVNWVKTGTRPN